VEQLGLPVTVVTAKSTGRRLRVLDALGDLARELEQATRDPVIREIADAQDRTPGQVALRCLLDQPSSRPLPRCRGSRSAVFEVSLSRSNGRDPAGSKSRSP
jgi:hypothetical protein